MTTPVSMTDLLNLYKPGQLSDLASMIRFPLSSIKSARFSTAVQADVRYLGTRIADVRTKAVVAGVINTAGPNAAKINSTLAKYATIPTILSGYIQPTVITNESEFARDNIIFGPIIAYLAAAVDDFCIDIIYLIIQDNITSTDATKINNIKNLVVSFVAFVSDLPVRINIPTNLLDPNFIEIASRITDVFSRKLGVTITPPNSIGYQDFLVLCCKWPWPNTEVTSRPLLTASLINELASSVKLPLVAIANAKAFDTYNTPKNITLLKSIPSLLQALSVASAEPFAIRYIENHSASIFPVPAATNTLFTNLTKDNFTASLSQTSTGIMNYIIQTIVSSIFYAKAQKQVSDVINVKFSPAQAQMDTLAKVILMLKEHVKLINTIINIFQIKLADDPVSLRLANIFNNVTMKNKFSINTVPVASGGKRRSKKRRQRRRTTKNLRPK